MKKVILLLGIMIMSMCAAQAACDYQCVAPYGMNSKFRTVTSAVTGFNALTENRVEAILKKEVLKIGTADNLKIKLDSYSPRDLKNGIFKSMKISGRNVLINDIHFSQLEMNTLCEFNYIKQVGKELVFKEDMPLAFSAVITADDLNKTMLHPKYKRVIDDLNKLSVIHGVGVKIASTKAAIKNNKFYYIIGLEVPFIRKDQKIVFQSNLNIKDGNIYLANTQLVSGNIKMDLRKIDFIMKYLNPLDFSVEIFDNKDADVNVKNIKIKDNVIYTDGVIVIAKD